MQNDDILIRAKYLETGLAIWPLTSDPKSSIDSQLSTLTPQDARKCKRKFRKEWRKAKRAMEDRELADSCFGSGKAPTTAQTRIRRSEVHKQLVATVAMENPK